MQKKSGVMTFTGIFFFTMLLMCLSGCAVPKINLFSDRSEPLREFTLDGRGKHKVVVIHVQGEITSSPEKRLLTRKPGMVQAIVSQLRCAQRDRDVRAVVLAIDSPGGSVTASDLLYHEILTYKRRSGVPVVAAMMDVAASGGYYISLAADHIMAHPTTITGSIGAVFLRPDLNGLMQKIGVDVKINKSGKHKDMGYPVGEFTDSGNRILQDVIDEMGKRFLGLVQTHRKIDPKVMEEIATARIYLAGDAEKLGLIDGIGYFSDAVEKAGELAGLSSDYRVIVYRRTEYPDDNLYNVSTAGSSREPLVVADFGILNLTGRLNPGFYYLWCPSGADGH